MPQWLQRWLDRHQHPVSRVLHLLGIPMTIAALILAGVQLADWRWDLWWRPARLLVLGYLLQWIGHLIEGNDMGELIVFKRWLGLPYVAVSSRYQNPVGRDGCRSGNEPESASPCD